MEFEESPDDRGKGGKAPRSKILNKRQEPRTDQKCNTPSHGFLSLLSPAPLLKAIKGALGSPRERRRDSENKDPATATNAGAGVSPRVSEKDLPGQLQHQQPQRAFENEPQAQAATTAAAPPETPRSGTTRIDEGGQGHNLNAFGYATHLIKEKQHQGWSPSKLDSLKFFLKGGAEASARQPQASLPTSLTATEPSLDAQRPYLGLKYLLRSGPSGTSVPTTWMSHQRADVQRPMASKPTTTSRFAPYSLQAPRMAHPTSRLQQAPTPNHSTPQLQATPGPRQTMQLALPAPVASTPASQLISNGLPTMAPPSAMPDSSIRLALANNGRLADNGAAVQRLRFAATPLPKSAAKPATMAAHGAVSGAKRDRESPGATPLVGSGIKNLAEYKRQRQRYTVSSKSILAVGAGTGSRAASRDVTPAASDSEGNTPLQPQLAAAAQLSNAIGTTETARRILETLDNMAKAQDLQTSTSASPFHKPGSVGPKMLGPPGATPYPKAQPPPPLDRLSPPVSTPDAFAKVAASPVPFAALPPQSTPMIFTSSLTPAADKATPTLSLPAPSPVSLVDAPGFGVVAAVSTAKAAPAASAAPAFTPSPVFSFGMTPSAAPAAAPQEATPARALVEEAAQASAVSAPPVFKFGGAEGTQDAKAKAVNNLLSGVAVAEDIFVPTFSFGKTSGPKLVMPKAVQLATPPVPLPSSPAGSMQEQVAQAAAVPLPDDDDEEDTPAASPTAASDKAAPGATPTANGATGLADKAAASPAPVTSGGWDMSFLNKANQAMASANDAVAKEVEAAKAGATKPAATAFAFGAPAAAVDGGLNATPKDAPSPVFSFGAAPATVPKESVSVEKPAAEKPSPAPAAPASSGGWDLSFLQKSSAAMSAANDAVATEIEKAKTPAASPAPAAAASPAPFGFGSPFPTTKSTTPGPVEGAAAAPAFLFGMTPTAAPQQQAEQPAAKPAEPTPTASTSLFGTPATGTQPAPFNFGGATAAPSSSPAFGFGTSSSAPAPASSTPSTAATHAAPSGGLFGAAGTPAAAAAAAASPAPSFGFVGAPSTPSSGPSFAFGQGAAPAFGTASTPAAAPGSTPAFGAGAPSPSFGFAFGAATAQSGPTAQAQQANSFGGPSAPFGGASSSPFPAASPALGAPPATSFAFGQAPASSPAPSTTGGFQTMFGSTPQVSQLPAQAPAPFGTPAAVPPFGGATPSFGSTTPAAENAFGAPGNTPFVFGQQQASPAPSPFGAAPSFGTSAQPAPSPFFGGAAPAAAAPVPAFGAPGAAPVSFGSAPPSGADMGGGGFGFTMGATGDQGKERRKVRARRHG